MKSKTRQKTCNLCDKDRKNFEGLVWYSEGQETYLCRSCYLKWCKSKKYKEIKEKYKDAKPTTKEWYKMCEVSQKEFDKWYYANGGVDDE